MVYLSSSGDCDSLCQNAKSLEDQSQNQFAMDLKNVAVQFGNTQLNANIVPQNSGAAPPLFRQDVNNIRPTTFNQIISNSFNNPKPGIPTQKTLTSQLPTTQNPRVSNSPATTTSTTPQQTTTRGQTTPQLIFSTPKMTPVRITNIPDSTPTNKQEQNKGGDTTKNRNTKITFTFNGVSS